jgi:Zn-dependent M28 family amino/carboxypeptidase
VRFFSVLTAVTLVVGVGACGGPGGDAVHGRVPENPDAFVEADFPRILADLGVLAHDSLEGRRTGTRGAELAQAYILDGFTSTGLLEPPAGFLQAFEIRGRRDTTQVTRGANVVGYVQGTEADLGAIVLTGHFDHLGIRQPRDSAASGAAVDSIFNGADDNASGTVTVMSLARYFVEHPPRHTMVFAAVDAEEMGLRGSRAFVEAGWPSQMVLNVNLDMVARSDSLLFAVGPFHYPQLRPILEAVRPRPPVVLAFGHDEPGVEGVQDWTGSSDHRPFHTNGIPFVYFGVEDHPDYHRASDEIEEIDSEFFLNSVRTILASVLAFDRALDVGPSTTPP